MFFFFFLFFFFFWRGGGLHLTLEIDPGLLLVTNEVIAGLSSFNINCYLVLILVNSLKNKERKKVTTIKDVSHI